MKRYARTAFEKPGAKDALALSTFCVGEAVPGGQDALEEQLKRITEGCAEHAEWKEKFCANPKAEAALTRLNQAHKRLARAPPCSPRCRDDGARRAGAEQRPEPPRARERERERERERSHADVALVDTLTLTGRS